MELRDEIRRGMAGKEEEVKRLDIDSFGKIMDKFVHDASVGVGVKKEENTDEWEILTAGCGAVMDFYIWLNGIKPLFREMSREMSATGQPLLNEKLARSLGKLLFDELMETGKEMDKEAETDGGDQGKD